MPPNMALAIFAPACGASPHPAFLHIFSIIFFPKTLHLKPSAKRNPAFTLPKTAIKKRAPSPLSFFPSYSLFPTALLPNAPHRPAPTEHYPPKTYLLHLLPTPSKTLHLNHLAIKCGSPAFAPAKSRAYIPPQPSTLPMLFKPLNHIATKQRLSLLAPQGNYHFTSSLY